MWTYYYYYFKYYYLKIRWGVRIWRIDRNNTTRQQEDTAFFSQKRFRHNSSVWILSKLIYSFECRHCGSRYVGRTIQHLNARIRQHVPLHLLPPEARKDRPRRGRPPKVQATRIDTGEVAIEHQPTEMGQLKRSARLAALKESAVSTGSSTKSLTALRSSSSEYQSAIAKHLSLNVECA